MVACGILFHIISNTDSTASITHGTTMQHLLEFNERPDLSHEDKETLIEDLVLQNSEESIASSIPFPCLF
jgi:hypothetical protein